MRRIRLILILAGRQLLELSRMPGILAVIFVPGIVLYAIFTLVLPTGGGGGGMPQIKLAVVDHDDTSASQSLVAALDRMSVRVIAEDSEDQPIDEAGARYLVEKDRVAAALIVPPGYAAQLFNRDDPNAGVTLIVNQAQPMAGDIVEGMLQMAAGMALFDMMGDLLEQLTGRRLLGFDLADDDAQPPATATGPANVAATTESGAAQQLLRVHRQGVQVRRNDELPPASMLYLAGLVPLFLLFNCAGAAGGLLNEIHTGATQRIMVAPVGSADYLAGYIVSTMVMSLLQCVAMYAFAALVFGAPVHAYLGGLAVLTVATCLATVGFGTLMGGVTRSAEQLNSLGTVVILGMSAIGGSMVPRFFMPDWVKPLGLFTINGWAYDGFVDVATGRGLSAALPETAVLVAIGLTSATLGAILLSRRLRQGAKT